MPSADTNADHSQPLSIGYMSPGWPLEAFANGIISYIADMAHQLPAMGHRVTILTNRTAGGEPGAEVYDVHQDHLSQNLAGRVVDRLAYRIAPQWTIHRRQCRGVINTLRRAIAERDIQLFEMEETFGSAAWLQPAVPIPVCLRLHGPWFLNGPAVGAPRMIHSDVASPRKGERSARRSPSPPHRATYSSRLARIMVWP